MERIRDNKRNKSNQDDIQTSLDSIYYILPNFYYANPVNLIQERVSKPLKKKKGKQLLQKLLKEVYWVNSIIKICYFLLFIF